MNLYFLVEGQSTEKKVYPAWLSHLLPELNRVHNYDEVDTNNYYLFSAEGYPSIIYQHLPNAVEEVSSHGKYNYLVMCLDADEVSVSEREQEIEKFIVANSLNLKLGSTKLLIIIQNRCIETWFLGNRKIYSRQPQSSPLLDYTRHYNVSINCPELMANYPTFNTHAQFHEAYLRELFRAKNMNYAKKNPGDVAKSHYLQQLLQRTQDQPTHLRSFQEFIKFCHTIKGQLGS